MKKTRFGPGVWLGSQLALLGLAGAMLAAWPPHTGALMLVPVSERGAARMVPLAVAAHALLLGAGPLPRSYIVRGDRDALARTMLAAGVLLMAAPAGGCGAQDRGE